MHLPQPAGPHVAALHATGSSSIGPAPGQRAMDDRCMYCMILRKTVLARVFALTCERASVHPELDQRPAPTRLRHASAELMDRQMQHRARPDGCAHSTHATSAQ